jgi:hypothetical protein
MLRLGVLGVAGLGCVFAVRMASAQVEPDPDSVEEPSFVPRAGSAAGAGFSVEGYVGMTAYHSERALRGHGVTGGIARLRVSYVTVGGFAERTDEIEFGRWEAFGGFAGVRLPFANWVDFEGSVGGGSRTHAEDDERYNSGKGYEWATPFAMLRFGLSDRSSSDAPLALRVGFEVFAMFDLKRHDQPWEVIYPRAPGIEPLVFRGTTPLGGSNVGVLVSVGFDVSLSPTLGKQKASVGTK